MREPEYVRTDLWREGKWVDLWSVVHFLSGMSTAFGLFLFHFGAVAALFIAFLLFVAYEFWEAMVNITETPHNRFMDVVVGLVSFTPTYFLLVPQLTWRYFIVAFVALLLLNLALSVLGWRASHKAALLAAKMRARYDRQLVRIRARRAERRLRRKLTGQD